MSNKIVLAIDTSHQVAVGLARGAEVVASAVVPDARAHVEQLMPLVQRTLAEADLTLSDVDQLVVGMGPGPFTGLRVGIVTAWTLAATMNIPVRGVCSLDAIAAQAGDSTTHAHEFVVGTDARRKEIYWARYLDGARVAGPEVSSPEAVPNLSVIGPEVEHGGQAWAARRLPGQWDLDPGQLAVHGPELPDVGTEPMYLRRPDATVPTSRKSALPTGPRLLRGLTARSGSRPTQPDS